jgi:hypothetical protein
MLTAGFGGGRVKRAKFPQITSKCSWSVDVLPGLVSLKPGSSPSPRCLALSVEGSACGSRSVRIIRCRGTGPGLSKWRQIGTNAGKLSAVIAVCWRRRGRGIQNQNECEYRC